MGGANQSLSEFVGFLGNPDMYGSMSTAAGMMGWLLQLVVFFLMVCAVIGVAFIVFKFGCDIVFLSGVGHMMGGKGQFVEKFASKSAKESDIMGYLKADVWKLVITLAFVGILASGMALPIAGQVAGVAGAVISKLVGVDVAGKVENFSYDEFSKSMTLLNPETKKAEYDKYIQEGRTYLDQIYKLSNSTTTETTDAVEVEQKISLYAISLNKAEAVAKSDTNTADDAYYLQHTKAPVCNAKVLSKFTGTNKVTCVE